MCSVFLMDVLTSMNRVFFLIYRRNASLLQRPISLTSSSEWPSLNSMVAKVALMECGDMSLIFRPELDSIAARLIWLPMAVLVMYWMVCWKRRALTGGSRVVPGYLDMRSKIFAQIRTGQKCGCLPRCLVICSFLMPFFCAVKVIRIVSADERLRVSSVPFV